MKAAGAAGATAAAGCLGDADDGDDDGVGDDTGPDFSDETLNFLAWEGYEGVAQMTEERTGADINLSLVSSNVESLNQLAAGGTEQFHILLLDNDYSVRNAQADHLVPLNEEDYPSREDWVDEFSWPYPTHECDDEVWAVCPRWGWGGIAYDEREVELDVLEEHGYSGFWTGGPNGEFENRITMTDWPTWIIPNVMLEVFDIDENPMQIELSDSELEELEEVLVDMFRNARSVHVGAAAIRQDFLEGNAQLAIGAGNFSFSQLRAEGHDWMQIMYPPEVGGIFWVGGICLIDNPDLNRDLANEFINVTMSPEGQYSICWEDATSKGAPVNEEAFDMFSEQEQQDIMMYEDRGFEAMDDILDNMYQYFISPQQDEWLEMWERAKARAEM